MKYIISQERLKSVFENYMDQFPLEINDMGNDVTVFIEDGERLFDTFDDHLAVNPKLWDKLEGLFGENMEDLLISWFNDRLTSNVKTADAAWDIYDEEDEDDY